MVAHCARSCLLSIASIPVLPLPHLPLSWMPPPPPAPQRAPFGASCWLPSFIHHRGPEALTQAAGVLPAVGETREHVVKYIILKEHCQETTASTLEASLAFTSLYNFRRVGLSLPSGAA